MTRWIAVVVILLAQAAPLRAQEPSRHLYVCRSPLLAFDFWQSVQNTIRQGITMTPTIAEQICAGMRAGADLQCIRVAASNFTPFASGWGGAMAMTDGVTKVWFHDPDSLGWIHPDYYIIFLNQKPR